jgi:NAD(P)-dependent dehydrogenase (short-subunit alcohol dehydrogenase family)
VPDPRHPAAERAFPDPALPREPGRRALVTGANRGLGRAIALGLARLGHHVIVGARERAAGDAVVAELRRDGGAAELLLLDVADPASIERAAAVLGTLDVLVNNAAILPDNGVPGLEVPLDVVRRTFEVNTVGPIALMQRAVPGMAARGFGRVVNVSSDWGSQAMMARHQLAYRVSKVALNTATRVIADEVRGRGVLVNTMHPGWVKTDMGGADATRSPEDAADTVLWLATLPADGPTSGFFHDRVPHAW